MAQAFNLTAQLNLRGPANIKQIAAQIRKDLGNISATVKFTIDPTTTKNVAGLNSALKSLNSTFSATVGVANNASSAIKNFSNAINSVNIKNIPQQINASAKAISSLNQASSSSSKALANASSEMVEFGKQAGLAVRRFAAFSAVTSVIYGVSNSINQGVQAFIDYDKQLTRIQQVTGESAEGLTKLQGQITNLSTSLGVSSKELTNVALTLAQAGLSARDTERALRALALSSLAPSFDDMNETVEGSIALMRQFGISAKDLEQSLGAVNAVSAKFAVEASDIITAIQRTGSVFATASKGVSEGKDALNEFIAVFTSVRATTRESAETIATGLRTIFTRIQRGSTINALKEFGVNLTDAQGKFVGAYKAVELLSQGLSRIDPRSLDFSRIIEELGGFRQIGKVIPLIQQFAVAQDALSVAQRGQGSLARDAVTAQKSLANQISKVREEFLALFREIGSSKSFQTIVRGALDLTSALIKVTSSLKGLMPALSILLAFKGVKALTQFTAGLGGGLRRGPDNKEGSGSAPLFNRGGTVRKFARGGLVPGQGDGDTVPAMLEPGEFVIRKKAVATIGAQNLHNMNQYASGGTIRRGRSSNRKRFAKGGAAQLASIDGDQTAIDGDTFTATVTPKAKQFTASFRISDFDTYETGNKTSRVSEAKAIQLLEIKKNKRKKAPQPSDSGYKIPSTYNVTEDLTASKAAELGKQALQQQIQGFKDVSKVKVGGGFGRYLASGFSMDGSLTTGRKWGANGKLEEFAFGGKVKKFAAGGRALRNVGYIDYDVIANEANKDIVEKGMMAVGVTGPRLYADYLTQLAVKARKDKNLDKLRAIYGVAGSGKTTLARGQGTDKASLRQTNRFPVLTPEDIQKASEILVLSSSVSRTKMDDFFGAADRTYTLSSTTKAEQERIKSQRASRDVTGIGLEGRQPGVTSGVGTDTAVGEALLGDVLGKKSVVLGRSGSGRLRRKTGKELVDVIKKKIAFTWGGFAPTTAGHESIMDAAAAMGFAPEDFIALVGANEGVKAGDPSSYRTAVFDQDFRVLLAKAGFGARGATVLPKPRDFEVPQAFDISREGADRRQVLIPKKGSRAFVADKTPEQTAKYKDAGYAVSNIERTGGISGTMVRDLIMAGDMGKLQKVLSPGVYELVSDNIGRLRNRANALPDIIEQVRASSGASLADIDKEIESLGIKRIDSKKVASDPEYAAKAQLLEELRSKKKKIQSAASFEPYRLLAQLAKAQPDKYGLNISRGAPSLSSMSGVSKLATTQMKNMGGLIRQFEDAGAVSATAGRALSRAEILKVLGTDGAAKAAGISSTQVYALLGLRSPDEKQKALREAIEKEYIKQVNRQAGAKQAETTKLQNKGLEFGAAGLFGKPFAAKNMDIESDKLSRVAKVRVLSGVMKQTAAEKIESIFQAGSQNLAQQAADAIRGEYGESGPATGSVIPNINTEASIQGGLLEKAVQMLGGPGATKGQGFDFPNGLQGAAKYFGLPGDIPTDLKRTLDGASTIKDNIVTYLKNVMGYASGGQVDRLTFEDIRKQIIDKYPDIDFRISKRKKGRGFGYNLLGALKADGGLLKSKGLKFEQPANLQELIETSDSIAQILLNPKEFALGGLADSSAEMSSLISGLYGNGSNNEKAPPKKEKQFGKIALRSDGQSISATYFKNDQRAGNVSAYKMRDYLYYVGLSQATSGYGPRLYDAVMEEATAKGAMLTSDRSSVSGDAKKVWEYYFRNRGDVKKTPLKPDDWTRNQADIDPKLFGKEDTWPPATDPAWILQSGYSKSPSLINDPTAVIRMGDQNDSRSMALQYFQRKALGGLIRKFAKGGSAEDTVPALLTPGEFVINKQAAQKIGYNKLAKLNNADKVQGYNAGGIVGGIARFAAGGGVGIPMFDWLSKLGKSYDRRPDTVSRATVGVDDETIQGVKDLVKSLNELGISAGKTAEILNAGGRVTYKEIEKAMVLDIQRLEISGAGIEQILQAEQQLAAVRKKRDTEVKAQQGLDKTFKSVSDRSSGSVQQEIISRARSTAKDRIEQVEAQRLAAAKKQQAKQEADATAKKGGALSAEEKQVIADRTVGKAKLTTEDKQKIYERSALRETSRVTGISRSDLAKDNISGAGILKYAEESMRDRKTLAQMDKQLLEMKLEEKRNSSEYIAASASEQRTMLAEARKAANEEISIRREMINKMAQQNGEMGVGSAGMFDFRNSPIVQAAKERYIAKKGDPSLMGLKGTALSDVALAAGAIGSQGRGISNLMYNTSTEGGKKQAAATGAGIEQAGVTLSTGLMAASQALTIPVVGPWIAGLTAVGTAAFAAADYFYDFTGSQKAAVLELEKSLNASKLEDATDKLDKAFSDFEADMSNLDLQKALGNAFTEYNRAASQSAVTELKDANFKAGQSRSWLSWMVGAPKPTIENDQMNELSRSEANRNSAAANKAASFIRAQINTGTTDINALAQNQEVVKAYGSGDVDVQKEVNNRLAIMAEKVGGINNITAEQRDKILLEVSTRKFLNDEQIKAAIKSKELADAMEDADRAGRKLAQSFTRLFNSINQSINRIKFESDQRKKLAAARAAGLNGQMTPLTGVSEANRTLNVLQNRNAYTPEEYQKAVSSTASMVPGEAGTRLAEAANLDATLGDTLNAAIASAVGKSRGTSVEEAKDAAIQASSDAIDKMNVSDEIKQTLKAQAKAQIDNAAKKANESSAGDPTRALDIFTDQISQSSNVIGDFAKGAQETLQNLAELKAAQFDAFIEGINESAKASKEAASLFKKSRDLMAQGQRTVKEVLTGQGESYADVKNRTMGDVARLTGGITDPTAIRQNIVNMSDQQEQKQKDLAAVVNDPKSTDADKKRASEQYRDFQVGLSNAKEALDMLADSTELVNKALDDLRSAAEMQKNRENFVNQLLTNTPEEADKLNQTFIRLQRNLSGGLNNPTNQRDARKAFNDTLRQTGNVREATRAGNTVLANQRKETLALMKDSGFRATVGLQMGMQNPNVSEADITQKLNDMELQLMKQMAVESGMMNNPLVQQAIAAKQDPKADPMVKARADRYLEAVGLQSKATKEQAELKAIESTDALKNSNIDLKASIDNLAKVVTDATNRDRAVEQGSNIPGGEKKVALNLPGASPLGKAPQQAAKGGIIYASAGQLINFQPKGTDTVPAMLSPGEFVINAQATAQHLPLLQAINDGQANVVSKGLSKGGLVYLAKGGMLKKDETIAQDRAALDAEIQAQGANYGVSQADQQEAIRLRDARVAAEQEEMFLAAGAMVDHSARHWTEHQFGAEWGKMTEEQQNTEIQKNLPRFQQLGQDYTTRRDAYVAQKGAEDEATGLWSKDRFTTENQHAFFRKEKERSGATYAAASQAEYDQQTKIRESNKTSQASARAELDRRQRVEDARQIAYGEKEVFAPTKKVSVDGKGNVTMVDWKPGEREAHIERRKKEAIDIVNKEEEKQGLRLTLPTPASPPITATQAPAANAAAAARVNTNSSALAVEDPYQEVLAANGVIGPLSPTNAAMFSISAPTNSTTAPEQKPSTQTAGAVQMNPGDFKPRNAAEARIARQAWAMGMTPAEFRYAKQQAYINKAGSAEMRARRAAQFGKGLLQPSERQASMLKQQEEAAKLRSSSSAPNQQAGAKPNAPAVAMSLSRDDKNRLMSLAAIDPLDRTPEQQSRYLKLKATQKGLFGSDADNFMASETRAQEDRWAKRYKAIQAQGESASGYDLEFAQKFRQKEADTRSAVLAEAGAVRTASESARFAFSQAADNNARREEAIRSAEASYTQKNTKGVSRQDRDRQELTGIETRRVDAQFRQFVSDNAAQFTEQASAGDKAEHLGNMWAQGMPGYDSMKPEEQERLALHYGKMAKDHLASGEKSGLPQSELAELRQRAAAEGISPVSVTDAELIDLKFRDEQNKKLADIQQSVYGGISGADTRASAEGASQLTAQAASLRAAAERLSRMSTVDSSRQIAQLTEQAVALETTAKMTTAESSNTALVNAQQRSITSPMLAGLTEASVASTVQGSMKDKTLDLYAGARQQEVTRARIAQEQQMERARLAQEKEQREREASAQAQAAENARLATEQQRQRDKAEKDKLWVNSSNPLVWAAGRLGGIGEATGNMLYGGANVVAGGITTAVSPLIGLVAGQSAEEIEKGKRLDAQTRVIQEQHAARGILGAQGTDQQAALAQAQAADYKRESATAAAAQVGIDAMKQGAYTAVEAGQAVLGQGPIMTGEQTALQKGDAKRVEIAKGLGTLDTGLGFSVSGEGLTRFGQNVGYGASQAAGALASMGANVGTSTSIFGRLAAPMRPLLRAVNMVEDIPTALAGRLLGGAGRLVGGTARLVDNAVTGGGIGRRLATGAEKVGDMVDAAGRILNPIGEFTGINRVGRRIANIGEGLGNAFRNITQGDIFSLHKGLFSAKGTAKGAAKTGASVVAKTQDTLDPLVENAKRARAIEEAEATAFTASITKIRSLPPRDSRGRFVKRGSGLPPRDSRGRFVKRSDAMARENAATAAQQRAIRSGKQIVPPPAVRPRRLRPKAGSGASEALVDNVMTRQQILAKRLGKYASSDEAARRLAQSDAFAIREVSTADALTARNVGGAGSASVRSAGASYNPGSREVKLSSKTMSGPHVDASIEHELGHAFQHNTVGGMIPAKGSKTLPYETKLMDSLGADISSFLKDSDGYNALIQSMRGDRTLGNFYSADRIMAEPIELLTSLIQASGSQKFASNTRAVGMLKKLMKFHGYSKGGLVYLSEGGWASKSPVLPSTAGTAGASVALAGLRGNIGYGIGMGVDNALGLNGTGAMIGSAADIGVGTGMETAKAANTLRAAGTALTSSGGASSLASAAGTGLAAGYGAYAVADLAGEAAALATGQTNLADYDKENRRQANQSYATNVGENIARPGRAAIQLGVESSGLISDIAEARAASRKFYEQQARIQESKDFAQAMMSNGTLSLASPDRIPQGFLTLDNKRVPQNRSSGGIIYANNGALALAKGSDTVPAMLTPGEFVVNREAAQTYMPILHAINSGHFNRGGIVNYLANGGVVAPKYYADGGQLPIQRSSSGSGVSNTVGNDVGAAISQALDSAVGQLSEFASNLTTGLQQSMEQYGQISQNINQSMTIFSESANKIETSAQTYDQAASSIPSTIQTTVTGNVMTNHTGLDRLTGNIEKDIYSNTAKQSSTISQNSIAHVDKTAYEGGLNSAANAKPMGMA